MITKSSITKTIMTMNKIYMCRLSEHHQHRHCHCHCNETGALVILFEYIYIVITSTVIAAGEKA